MKSVLNVGGNNKAIPIPPYYAGWEHHLLDIDPKVEPDLLMDARELDQAAPGRYDAVYCSHNLEHYHRADAAKVVAGFVHVLKEDGFVEIRVPDVLAVIQHVAQRGMDVDDVLYQAPVGPILVRDVLYGYSGEVEKRGNEFFAHKTAFSPKSLVNFMTGRGFYSYAIRCESPFEVTGLFFKKPISLEQSLMLGISM